MKNKSLTYRQLAEWIKNMSDKEKDLEVMVSYESDYLAVSHFSTTHEKNLYYGDIPEERKNKLLKNYPVIESIS